MMKFWLGKIVSREIWYLTGAATRERHRQIAIKEYYDEEQQKKDHAIKESRLRFASHIEKADRFLQNVVKLENMIEEKKQNMHDFFEFNGDTKQYLSFFITTSQKEELKRLLCLRPVDYINKDLHLLKTEQNTIEFILEQTDSYRNAEQIINSTGHRMYVNAQMATIYFAVVFK